MKLTNWKVEYRNATNLIEKVDMIAKMLGVWEETAIPLPAIPTIDYTDEEKDNEPDPVNEEEPDRPAYRPPPEPENDYPPTGQH